MKFVHWKEVGTGEAEALFTARGDHRTPWIGGGPSQMNGGCTEAHLHVLNALSVLLVFVLSFGQREGPDSSPSVPATQLATLIGCRS